MNQPPASAWAWASSRVLLRPLHGIAKAWQIIRDLTALRSLSYKKKAGKNKRFRMKTKE